MNTRKVFLKKMMRADLLLPGTVVKRYLKCRRKDCEICRKQGGHGPAYYLSIRGEDKRTHMIYVPKSHLSEVRKATAQYGYLRNLLQALGKTELRKWRGQTRRNKR